MPRVGFFELSKQHLSRIAAKTLQTYANHWIVINETLQNALDAIYKAKRQGRIDIRLATEDETVYIKDNGIGFPFDVNLLGFGGSGQQITPDPKLGGEMGVGLKTVILSSETFELRAQAGNDKGLCEWSCRVVDGYRYRELEPQLEWEKKEHVSGEETFTELRYKFPRTSDEIGRVRSFVEDLYLQYFPDGESIVDDCLAETQLEKFKIAIIHYFRTKSYAASVNNLLRTEVTPQTIINLNLKCTNPAMVSPPGLQEIFSQQPEVQVRFENKYWDAEEAIKRAKRPRPRVLTDEELPFPAGGDIGSRKNTVYISTFTEWDGSASSSIKNLLSSPRLRPSPSDERDFQKWIIGLYIVIAERKQLRRYLIGFPRLHMIAAHGIPAEAHDIAPPSDVWALGFVNNIHLLMSVKERLQYGKQALQNPHVVFVCRDLFKKAFIRSLRKAAENIAGSPESPPPPTPKYEIIDRPELTVPDLSIKKIPLQEMEVVALFYELIGKGIFREYETWSLPTHGKYDAMMHPHYSGVPFEEPRGDRDLSSAEFKVRLSDLVRDFDHGVKEPTDVVIAICWENDFASEEHERYEVCDIKETSIWEQGYQLPYIRYCLRDRDTGWHIQVLELKQVLEEHRQRIQKE